MSKVTYTGNTLKIEISDPGEIERLVTVMARTNSTRVLATRKAIKDAIKPVEEVKPTTPVEVDAWHLVPGDTILLPNGDDVTPFKIDCEDDSSRGDYGEAIFFDAAGNAVGFGQNDKAIVLV